MTPADFDATVAELLPCDCRYPTTKHTMNCAITLRPAVRAKMRSLWNEAVEAAKDTFNYPQAYEHLCALRIPEET